MNPEVPESHPRYKSLTNRHKIIEGCKKQIVAYAGLIAHGRGESFDYLVGEETIEAAFLATDAAVCMLLNAEHPILSVNGNIAALCGPELVEFSKLTDIPLEINLFYRTKEREDAIYQCLKDAGATNILGVGDRPTTRLSGMDHARRIVDTEGILIADVVFVPLEDGDRTEALVNQRKKVVTVDLNPLSRTAQKSTITIVDNIIRTMPLMIELASKRKKDSREVRKQVITSYNNNRILSVSLRHISERLEQLARKNEEKQ